MHVNVVGIYTRIQILYDYNEMSFTKLQVTSITKSRPERFKPRDKLRKISAI